MTMHFEELWEKCEKFHQDDSKDDADCQSVLDELMMKINLYKVVLTSQEAPKSEDVEKAKSRLLGEILLTLTNLSLKENINVFEALATAYKHRTIDFYSQKYE